MATSALQGMKPLLIISALVEGATGIAFILIPAVTVSMLLNAPPDTPAILVACRIGGAAISGLAIECWLARNGERSILVTGVVKAMSYYNFAAALVLFYAGVRLELRSALLFLAILLHIGLGAWCMLNLRPKRRLMKVARFM